MCTFWADWLRNRKSETRKAAQPWRASTSPCRYRAATKNNPNPPEYIPIVCWAEQAEFVGRYLTKGRQIVVDGRLTTRKWEDKNGAKRKDVEVTAGRIYFADSNHSDNGGN